MGLDYRGVPGTLRAMPRAPHPAVSETFTLRRLATPEDIDLVGHVSNMVYLRWVIEVALAHSDAVGLDHAAYKRIGSIFVVRRHELDYRRPCYAGDAVTLCTWVESWRGASSVRRTSIRREKDDTELLAASSLWAYISLERACPQAIPADVRARFEQGPT